MPSWIDFFLFVTCQEVIRSLELDVFGVGEKVEEVESWDRLGRVKGRPQAQVVQLIQSTALGFGCMHSNKVALYLLQLLLIIPLNA